MKNSQKYNFSDFTLLHYEEIINKLKENHVFSSFTNYEMNTNFVIKRHDVDFSMDNSLKLAKIESDLGVTSTFFLMLRCEFYNLLEYKNIQIVNEILDMGHTIGLHFDAEFYNISTEDELNEKLIFEKQIFEDIINTEIDVFSFHNTTDFTMNCEDHTYGGLINTYSKFFKDNLGYCSDSNGYWRFNRMIDFINLNKNKKLQILTHPVWWTEKIDSPKMKINKLIDKQANDTKKFYNDLLISYKKNNIDWD